MDLNALMGYASGQTAGGPFTTASNSLGKDDFMLLLVTQLKNQDPFQPVENQEFVAQLAQFSTLEQTQNMADNLGDMAGLQNQLLQLESLAQGAGLLGKTVVYAKGDGVGQGEGEVESLEVTSGGIVLHIGEDTVPLGAVMEVRNGGEGEGKD